MPEFNIGDQVVFTAPFDGDPNVYTVYGIQYIDEKDEFTDTVTGNYFYRLCTGIANSVETYLDPAPV